MNRIFCSILCVLSSLLLYMYNLAVDDTVEVVNVVMNNMENYLPNNVVEEDKEKLVCTCLCMPK